jgi:serine/threonine-protein kinase
MAKVFKATDTRLGRTVAIKVLAPEYAHNQDYVQRFQREATAAARLNSPNIVGVYDSGSAGDVHYLVMEYVQGRTLAEVLAQDGRLLPERAIEIADHIASALSAAAAAGIVHRDIKPGNVMLTADGQVKVMDFGIARMDTGQTVAQTQAVMGTASYLSPEQAQGGPVDSRSDLYSLGVVLYEMLTGRPPFAGDSAVSVAMQHVQDSPTPPSQLATGTPPALDAVIMRALAKNPANRYQSADEFRLDLNKARLGQQIAAPPVMADATQILPAAAGPELIEPPSTASKWGIGLLIAAIVAALAFGAFLLGKDLLGGKESPSPSASASGAAEVAIPEVIGMTPEEAETALTEAGFELGEVRYKQTDKMNAGQIFKQTPGAGVTAVPGTLVEVVVAETPSPSPSQSPSPVPAGSVPDVRGMTFGDAKKAIKDAGFDLGEVTEESSDSVPDGSVIKQDPKPGVQYDEGSPVDLWVSNGKSTVTVPALECLTTSKAQNTLQGLGLEMAIVDPPSPNPACPQANKVGSQDTDPGTEVEPGTTIDVHVSGP